MCGIIGVAGVPAASRVTYLGLYSLQHRGQESAGMVTVDGAGVARSHRGMGLVSDVFSESVLGGLAGDVAIGHTRYSTAGSSVLANAQPILAGYHEGPLALAHNGNLTNAEALRSDLVAKGSIFQTSSDSEVLIHLIARSEAREPEDQLLDALERVEGAYSLVVTIGRTLYAIVDPRGFRPLWLGKLGTGYVLASETCALDLIGATTVRELQPGEFLRIQGSPPEIDRLPALPPKPHQRCIFELVYFSRPDSTIFGRSVDRVRRALGREVAQGKRVVVVDDSLVRGTTSRELVQMIRQAGAKEVHFRVASAPITGPCYYGIDTPTKSELIASSHSLEEIRQHLGVETLGYLSLDGMLRAAGGDATEFCHACFSGEYPTEIPDDTQKATNAAPVQVTIAV